jgi:hypothetical protein
MAWVVSALLLGAGPAAAGDPRRTGVPIGYAAIDGLSGTVRAIGGRGTTSATGIPPAAGARIYRITFAGRYPFDIAPEQVVGLATANTFEFVGTSVRVASASPTEVVVDVQLWETFTASAFHTDFFLTLFLGRTP